MSGYGNPNIRQRAREFAGKFLLDSEVESFETSLFSAVSARPSVVWTKPKPESLDWPIIPPLDCQPDFVDCLNPNFRAGPTELHTKGFCYCLDYSSIFEMLPLIELKSISSICDVCSAPGGKAITCSVIFSPERLVCNEVVGKRRGSLVSNLKRCSIPNVELQNLDSKLLASRHPRQFDLVLVDAPCSGQSLLAKQIENPGCFNKLVIEHNAKRQRRILANSIQLVKPRGFLLYSTCTFALEENEKNVEWLLSRFPQIKPQECRKISRFKSRFSEIPCYRLWPFNGWGVGGFCFLGQMAD